MNPIYRISLNSHSAFRIPHSGNSHSPFPIPHSPLGQASLEMTLALWGALLLLLGSMKVCLWIGERLVRRQQYYNCTRVAAGSSAPGAMVWDDPAVHIPLNIFGAQAVSPDPC